MSSKNLYIASVIIYILSLLLPLEGVWFGGIIMMFLTGLFSILTIQEVFNTINKSNDILGLLFLALPFFNIFYINVAIRFYKFEALFTASTIVLFISTAIALAFAIFVIISHAWWLYSYLLWCASLIIMLIALLRRWRNA